MSNETLCVEPYESAEIQEECEQAEFQQLYWSLAIPITLFSILALGYLAYESRRNIAIRKVPIVYFTLIILSDVIYVGCFFPYHINNIFQLNKLGFVDLQLDTLWCSITVFLELLSLQLNLFGCVLVTYIPYKMTQQANNMRRRDTSKVQWVPILALLAFSFFVALSWGSYVVVSGLGGSFRGLYCGATSYANINGVLLFLTMSVSGTLITYFSYKAYQVVKQVSIKSGRTDSILNKVADDILRTGLYMAFAIVITWAPLAISAFLNVFGVILPIQFDMFGGLVTKVKPAIDVFLLLQMPQVVNEKKKMTEASRSGIDKSQSKLNTKGQSSLETGVGSWLDATEVKTGQYPESVIRESEMRSYTETNLSESDQDTFALKVEEGDEESSEDEDDLETKI